MSQGSGPRAGPEDGVGGASSPAPAVDPADQLARLGRSWVWLLGAAVATLVPGVLALVWPDVTLHVLAVLIGVYLLLIGAFRFVAVFGRRRDHARGLRDPRVPGRQPRTARRLPGRCRRSLTCLEPSGRGLRYGVVGARSDDNSCCAPVTATAAARVTGG